MVLPRNAVALRRVRFDFKRASPSPNPPLKVRGRVPPTTGNNPETSRDFAISKRFISVIRFTKEDEREEGKIIIYNRTGVGGSRTAAQLYHYVNLCVAVRRNDGKRNGQTMFV